MAEPKFKEGDIVIKTKGARFWGKIISDPYYTVEFEGHEGKWHYNVMAVHPEFLGTVHIMVESQIELKGE